MDLLASFLEETHNPGPGIWTRYSCIADPAANTLRLFYFHTFQEYMDIGLRRELARGERHFHLPSLFSNITIEFPSAGAVVEGTEVTFRWQGYQADYSLSCSTDKDFKDCRTVAVSRQTGSKAPLVVVAAAVSFSLLFPRNRRNVLILLAIVMLLSLASCPHAPSRLPKEEPRVYSRTISDLQAGRTWYWRIRAERTKGFTSACEGGMFRTAE